MFVPVTTPPPPSKHAVELGGRITALVREYRAADPSLTRNDLRQAFALARQQVSSELGGADPRRIAVVLGVLVALALGFVLFFIKSGGGLPVGGTPIVGLAIGLLAVVCLAVAVLARR